MDTTLSCLLDGITTLPRRHVATIKFYLERDLTSGNAPPPLPAPLRLERLRGDQSGRYRSLFATLGTRWLWWSRLMFAPGSLAVLLDRPATEAFAVCRGDRDIGLLELDLAALPVADLAFLGLFDGETGKGAGRALMAWALARMAEAGARRASVNTCTFDSPHALGFYRASGFELVRQAVEIVPDPRLSGLLPATAAPHVPILA
ncbi:MAG TPA: GNAT family N-acetyltransferase [Beijerinckiaceae bacterium]|nr:GNAT family N-acetyltransferase [Beijerinckiaceae bacterium]